VVVAVLIDFAEAFPINRVCLPEVLTASGIPQLIRVALSLYSPTAPVISKEGGSDDVSLHGVTRSPLTVHNIARLRHVLETDASLLDVKTGQYGFFLFYPKALSQRSI
jgi:hypothetical protein